jgi:eukaryotic-like serine/threonine-protein kinase
VRVGGANDTLWIHDFRRGDAFSRLTFRGNVSGSVWTPDGLRIVYNIGNEIASIAADGSGDERTVFTDEFTGIPTSITPDGRTLLYQTNRPGTGWDIWALELEEGKARPVLAGGFTERSAQLSPDGRWIAYMSNESGRDEVYVRPFPALGRRYAVSRDGGSFPVWSPTGRDLYFRRGQDIYSVAVLTAGQEFESSLPTKRVTPTSRDVADGFAIASDGRLLMIETAPPPLPDAIHLATGWLNELRARVVPTR